ncbi:MAG: carbamate kinase [Chloroflexi bacterium]|nr:carbamate kinase [Chloroflexota bacterium]MDA1271929.1 carbamate kinase [Chloroflexota bacterium]
MNDRSDFLASSDGDLPNDSRTIVIALGGNAILPEDDTGDIEQQMLNMELACRQLAPLIRSGNRVVLTHGNGPQVGNLLIQQEESGPGIPKQPLDICVGMTQGQIGSMLQQVLDKVLRNEGIKRDVVTLVSHFVVGEDDPDFSWSSKPIGPFLDAALKEQYEKRGHTIMEVHPGSDRPYRRSVPSPMPLRLLERRSLRALVNQGAVVIAGGGGGIPVVLEADGSYRRVEAVIDKDLAGEKLAESVDADLYLILTDVETVSLDFGTARQRPIGEITVSQAREYLQAGQFGRGSMAPKVMGCIRFVEFGGERAVITGLNWAESALAGSTGTHIVPG